ncbi:MAG: YabP/YqfC family sporulation protein [Clostridia bacterium]
MNKIEEKLIELSRKIEVPTNIVRNVSKIEIIASDTVLIENHCGILHLAETEVYIDCGNMIAKIYGFDLKLGAISKTDILILGEVTNLDFEKVKL